MNPWRATVMVTIAAVVAAVGLAVAGVGAGEVSRGILEVDTLGKVDVPRKATLVAVTVRAEEIPPKHVAAAKAALADVNRILKQLGIPQKDIREKSVEIRKSCTYYCSFDEVGKYRYRVYMDVLLPTIDAAVALISYFRGNEASIVTVDNIRFPFIDPEPLVRTAQQLSIDALEEQALAMATAMGGRLGDIVALRSHDNKARLLDDDRSGWSTRNDRALSVFTTGRIEMFHNFG
ncbi:hypothetical protein MMPV_003105 [Pyropia vietnamensis]